MRRGQPELPARGKGVRDLRDRAATVARLRTLQEAEVPEVPEGRVAEHHRPAGLPGEEQRGPAGVPSALSNLFPMLIEY